LDIFAFHGTQDNEWFEVQARSIKTDVPTTSPLISPLVVINWKHFLDFSMIGWFDVKNAILGDVLL
jgi:hypothetical protein